MSNSPAWDDINPVGTRPSKDQYTTLRDAANRVRQRTNLAIELIAEGQLDRAANYLAQAQGIIEELR